MQLTKQNPTVYGGSINRRNFISMLGLSALVAKVFPAAAKTKEAIPQSRLTTAYLNKVAADLNSPIVTGTDHLGRRWYAQGCTLWMADDDFTAENQQQRLLCTKS